jgi:hypothetical protein
MEVSGQLHAPAALPPGKEPTRYPLDRKLSGPQSRSGHGDKEKNSPVPAGNRTLEPRSSSTVTQRYTDWAITALKNFIIRFLNK